MVERGRVRPEPDAEPGEEHDRELEALAPVDGEHAHGVVVGLGDDRLVDPCAFFALLVEPADEAAQARAAGVGERVRGVGEEAEPAPVVTGPPVRQREGEQAALAHDPLDRVRRGLPEVLLVQRPKLREADHDRVARVERLGWRAGRSTTARSASRYSNRSASEHPNAGVRSAATSRISSAGSSIAPRIDDEITALGGREQERLALDAQRDVGGFERGLELGQQRAGRDEHGDVGEAGGTDPLVARRVERLGARLVRALPAPASPRSGPAAPARRARSLRGPGGRRAAIDFFGTVPPRRATGTGTCGSAGRNAWSGE